MKKLSLLLFIAGLFAISFLNTNCARKEPGISPITGDTQTVVKVDSTGEDVIVTVKQDQVTSSSVADSATVYLVNNQVDEDSFIANINNPYWVPSVKKYMKIKTTGSDGVCTFSKVKPPSNTTPFADPNYGKPGDADQYIYYVHAVWENPTTFELETGAYNPSNQYSDPVAVSINNGNTGGEKVVIAVKPQ